MARKTRHVKPSDCSTDDFDRILVEIINAETPDTLLAIPGIYEVLSEHYNNEVLDAWQAEQDANSSEDEQP